MALNTKLKKERKKKRLWKSIKKRTFTLLYLKNEYFNLNLNMIFI